MVIGKSKFDYEIDAFRKAFQNMQNKKIVLYGTGRMTATLIAGITDYQIIGLCDRDNSLIGKEVYGKLVMSKEEVEEKAEILIINTDRTYWNTIYKRIQDWNIPIYFCNGKRAFLLEKENKENIYWKTSYEALRKEIKKYEVISFDIFDTLLTRKVMTPFDVFRIVELQVKKIYGNLEFCTIRKQATALLENPTYDEIYAKIKEISGWEETIVLGIKQIELETEYNLIVPRYKMVQLCNEMIDTKEVYFVSDMYFTKEILLEMLLQIGVKAKLEQIIVSCDLRKTKDSGKLWKWYKTYICRNRKAIHIGDNKQTDVCNPKKYHIDAFYVMNVKDMLENSSIKDIAENIITLQSSIVLGMICSKIFNDPFKLNKTKGKIYFEDEEEAGYILLGNVMYNFHLWLLQQTYYDKVNKIVFFAREAYLLLPQYEYICELLGLNTVPKAYYLEISRRAIFMASIENKNDIHKIAEFPFRGSAKEFLEQRFGIFIEDEKLENIQISELQKEKQVLYDFIDNYICLILKRVEVEKRNYKYYIDGFEIDERTGIVDSVLYGTTQFYLQKFLKKKVKGYYFCACQDESNQYYKTNQMKGCFQETQDKAGKKCSMYQYSKFNEAFYTAPNGMLMYIDDHGNACYTENMENQKKFQIRQVMQKGIFLFFSEIIDLQKKLKIDEFLLDQLFADKLYGCMMNEGFIPTEEMKTSFYFDNRILDTRQSKIWEN